MGAPCGAERNDGFDGHPADRDGFYPDDASNDVPGVRQRGRRHTPISLANDVSALFFLRRSCFGLAAK
jgi:hypothetical protein